ncbi:MAG: hypothetical protein JWL87_104 [Candidatus Adlerbacteria bacterium]|nr:hypothetical protein [Candidatus Adlerbacteria bacterium]
MEKATYVDGFVLVVPKAKAAAYKKMATEGREAWLKFGALDYKECVIEDANPKDIVAPFGKMIKAKPGEQVWFSYITFSSKTHRNQVNKKVMAHFGEKYADAKPQAMPFDMKRMAYGGFKVVVG